MSRILQVFCILFSATVLSLGIPNEIYHFGSPFLGLISLVPMYLVYSELKSYKESFLYSFLHALCVHLISSYWLAFFKDFAAFTLGASALGTSLIAGLIGLFYFLPFSANTKKQKLEDDSTCRHAGSVSIRILWFAAIYTLYEWVKSSGFIAYPWGTISSTMFRWKIFIQLADITGTYGITFLSAFFAAILAEGFILFYKARRITEPRYLISQYARTALAAIIIFIIVFGYGAFRLIQPARVQKYLNAIMVQQNADPWKQSTDNDSIRTSQRLTKGMLEKAAETGTKIDLVVWSEGCLKYYYPLAELHYKNYPLEKPMAAFIKECSVPFILGGSYLRSSEPVRRINNSAFLFDKDGEFRGFYGKNHLVPFAECIPFSGIPAVANFLKKVIHISAGFTPGDQYTLFEVQGSWPEKRYLPESKVISLKNSKSWQTAKDTADPYVKFSTPICFDDSFPDVCRPLRMHGSETFINLTDDSWSKTKSAEYQHFVIAAFRTIEYRTSMARSCNSGYSVVLDTKGNILQDQPLFEESAMIAKIPVYEKKNTIYLRLGNWLPKLIAWIAILTGLVMFFRCRMPDTVPSERTKLNRFSRKYKRKLLLESNF
ncbi:MAG: apolipoprotein N-acyltransferase [Treponema sp.]|nr:apolipoprotein N-acyltransferase [Treponema sp.]